MTQYVVTGRESDKQVAPYNLITNQMGVGQTISLTLSTQDESTLINAGMIIPASWLQPAGGGGPPTAYQIVSPSGGDDAAAIKAAVATVVTAGIANGSYYGEVWFDSTKGPLLVQGALDTSQSGSAQIPIPIVPTNGPKFTLVLRAKRSGSGAGWHWHQTVQQPCTLFSSGITGTGEDSIIGGPKNAWVDPNGAPSFSNMQLVLDGMTIGATHDSGLIYVDARHIAQFNGINGLGVTTERTAAAHTPVPSNSNTVGVYFPKNDNNDNNGVDNLVCYDVYYGFAFADHFRAQRIQTIYCVVGGLMTDQDGGTIHGAWIDYWSCEGGGTILQSFAGVITVFPIHIGRIDIEAQTGTYDFDDVHSSMFGDIGWSEDAGALPKLNGATNLRIIDCHRARGHVASPSVPATTVALVNPFWRDAAVNVTGGTVTVIAVDGTATGLTAGTVIVPSGKAITLTYSVAPAWNWVLL